MMQKRRKIEKLTKRTTEIRFTTGRLRVSMFQRMQIETIILMQLFILQILLISKETSKHLIVTSNFFPFPLN